MLQTRAIHCQFVLFWTFLLTCIFLFLCFLAERALVFIPFPSNHLNDFSNDLNVFEKPLGCFRQTIRMNPENHLDDFAGRTKKKKKTLQKSFPKVLKSYFNTSQVRQETSFSIDALTKIFPFNRHFYSHIHTIPTTENYFPVILQTK